MEKGKKFILWFNELGIEDVPFVGGKNASLGEMYRMLTPKGVNVPNGFAVSAYAYRHLLETAGIKDDIMKILSDLDTRNMQNLADRGRKVRSTIRNAELPTEVVEEIEKSYDKLCSEYGKNTDVAVRSSATAEDLPDASFAGQQETYLNIRGKEALIDACKRGYEIAVLTATDEGFPIYERIGFKKIEVMEQYVWVHQALKRFLYKMYFHFQRIKNRIKS